MVDEVMAFIGDLDLEVILGRKKEGGDETKKQE